MYICVVNEEKKQRSFKPYACATENNVNTTLIKPNTTWNDQYFRYKCEKDDNKLTLKALTCLLSDVHVTAGTTIRRGETEYQCVLDNSVYMKLIQKRMLHDFCMPGNQNDSMLENDQCPGLSISAIHAKYGSGTAVTFDEKTIVDEE
ncbi:unnamed protein product [Bursaphelenchus okinawaensis]|uniref:Abnormal cell migration protein 18-like fibronectin type I domain-containing protein n=1 Tax=Bursaphelenchus okinawaensis TaxID=465554 RepID=A0A811LQ25_9BILA|nr:unnamed protein product [Bursaphelenchus okinawaensis]CAG9127817.1 unnamed protein product [Bursaphelenchus okinawaensis]